jgi:ketosteroid isomerase-like protein
MSARDVVIEMLRCTDESRYDDFRAGLEPGCEWVNPMVQAHGPDEVVRSRAAYGEAFPERRHELSRVLEAGATVAVEGEWVATHAGPLATPDGEIPATGRTVRVPFAAVIRVADGSVDSVHVYLDPLGFMAQLGLAPQPAAA